MEVGIRIIEGSIAPGSSVAVQLLTVDGSANGMYDNNYCYI